MRAYNAAVAKRRLPVGIQTFRIIREEGFYYVDKTGYIRRLLDDDGTHYFLSRPRRFGKSLFVDTLKEFFQGSEELFRGLAVHDGWNWSRSHPVVRLSFGGGNYGRTGQLLARMAEQLADLEREAGVPASEGATPSGRFARLLAALHRQSGRRVVVLVDEYDKPILDALDDAQTARANRDDLRGLYGTIKDCDAHIELTFITGVSKFSKVSRPRNFRKSFLDGRRGWDIGEAEGAADGALFSDLNNLTDLTLDPAYSAICGYTEADLDTVFAAELPGLDRARIRAWYNGYNWLGKDRLYNPFGILKLFASRRFRAHWFETATPRFLVDTLLKHGFAAPDLETVRADEDLLSAFDADSMAPEALLFQTGYLTIAAEEEDADGLPEYRLRYPNLEVRRGLNRALLDALAPNWRRTTGSSGTLRRLLAAEDWAGVEALFRALLAGIPHDWHRRNDIALYEGYWASVFYAWFQASMDGVVVEDATSRGRLDMAVLLAGNAYLFEFKVSERSEKGVALAQLKERGYADKHRVPGRSVHLIGVEVSAETRDLVAFQTEPG